MVAGGKDGIMMERDFDKFSTYIPIEVSWGVEEFASDQLFCAIGAHLLQMQRKQKQDACMPPDAMVLESPDEDIPDAAELRARFDRLWELCVAPMGKDPPEPVLVSRRQLKDCCSRRYAEYAEHFLSRFKDKQRSNGFARRLAKPLTLPRCIFPNIGDILAVPSTRMYTGQVCVVRYRLMGASNFWSPQHKVLKDEDKPVSWPVKKADLGQTPFIGLVPRGLHWAPGGGGGFYLGKEPFTRIDYHQRADLPTDPSNGHPLSFGTAELTAPSLVRTSRSQNDGEDLAEDFEIRLFCSNKGKIVGCIGEAVPVTVVHQNRPTPISSLQVQCTGRTAELRWRGLDLGRQAKKAATGTTRIWMKPGLRQEGKLEKESIMVFDHEIGEFTLPDLVPDTEYEFHVRLENVAGVGREAYAICRTNAICGGVSNLICAVRRTHEVELRWHAPKELGNDKTRDRYQQQREAIASYQAKLKVEETDELSPLRSGGRVHKASKQHTTQGSMTTQRSMTTQQSENASEEKPEDTEQAEDSEQAEDEEVQEEATDSDRMCEWPAKGLKENPQDNFISVKVDGLRPDTQYCLDSFCAVTSMGSGKKAKGLKFWTVPEIPEIGSLRVKGQANRVFLQLKSTGGNNVRLFNVIASLPGKDREADLTLDASTLRASGDGESEDLELPVPFDKMPLANSDESHTIKIRAENSGGWSGWSPRLATIAITRQQGAEACEAALKAAIEARSIDDLAKMLKEAQDIEFENDQHKVLGAELLARLQEAKDRLDKAIKERDPDPLREALEHAKKAELPGLAPTESMLAKLDRCCEQLNSAKGIDALRRALQAAHEAKLPPHLVREPIERLSTREAAQVALSEAITAARVAPLAEALHIARGMHLPSEKEAETRLIELEHSEGLLKEAVRSKKIVDLHRSLKSANETGLREDALLEEARNMLDELHFSQEEALEYLRQTMDERYPNELEFAIQKAREAQTPEERLQDAREMLRDLQSLMDRLVTSTGDAERQEALEAAKDAKLPEPLLEAAELQLQCLKTLHVCLKRGCVDMLRKALKDADQSGVKATETDEARFTYNEWRLSERKVEVGIAISRTDELRRALQEALDVGINADQLEHAAMTLQKLERRDEAEKLVQVSVESKICEELQRAIKEACDTDVNNAALMYKATTLLERMLQLRSDLAAAMESGEVTTLFDACNKVREEPSLPVDECFQAERMLEHLQVMEHHEFVRDMDHAVNEKNYRVLDHLGVRAARLAESKVETPDLQEAQRIAKQAAEDERMKLELQLQNERVGRVPPRWGKDVPACRNFTRIPTASVVGDFEVFFGPSGELLTTLPREIVEGTFVIYYEDVSDMATDVSDCDAICHKLVLALRKLVSPEDEVLRLDDSVYDDYGRMRRRESVVNFIDGKLEINFAIHIRALHSGCSVAEALCARGPLGGDLFWGDDEERPGVDMAGTVSVQPPYEPTVDRTASNLAGALSNALTKEALGKLPTSLSPQRRRRPPRRLTDFVRRVQVRQLRRITLELAWSYPQGLMDTLDVACFLYDADQLLEIVDHRGRHSARRGQSASEAVRHEGDMIDREKRRGKQKVQVRLDLMPSNATDIFFALSAYNSRDLSKFTGLQATIYDTDSMRELCTCNIQNPGAHEAVIMCSVYRLPDYLWRSRMIGVPCRGTARDYKPILSQLLELGYPRNKSMHLQVDPLMKGIQQQFMLDVPVKPTAVSIGLGSTMRVSYAIELFGPAAICTGMVQEITRPRFCKMLVAALEAAGVPGVKRFGLDHIVVFPAKWNSIQTLRYEMCWRYPSSWQDKRVMSKEVFPPQEDNFLDAACMVFEAQALRDVVDYRGPHGVRIVHNGVLDYGGVWVGKVGIGDATGGAVRYKSESMDNARRVGKHTLEVQLDKLPQRSTDLYFTLAAPVNADISKYQELSARILDAQNPGHELASVELKNSPSEVIAHEATVMCCMSLDGARCWGISSIGCSTQGSVRDFRPILQCLRAIQEKKHEERKPEWPHQLPILGAGAAYPAENVSKLPGPPRLLMPKASAHRSKHPVGERDDSRVSTLPALDENRYSQISVIGAMNWNAMGSTPRGSKLSVRVS
jgi:stress response protein SCP2